MRAALVGVVLVSAGVAAADPLPTATVDVDGDGAADQVHIEAPGQLLIDRGGGAGQLVPFGASGALTDARLTIAGPGPLPFVVATAKVGGRWEAIALRFARGGVALAEIWRGEVGPAGDDDEYERWIAAEPEGLIRYQTRADHRRCDGTPTALFRERWDDKTGGFVAIAPAPIAVPKGAAVVAAKPAPSGGVIGGWYRVVSASTQAGARDASMLAVPRALGDDDPATAWREDGADDGRGTVWNFRASVAGGKAAALRIVPVGDVRGAAGLNRVARLAVISASGTVVVDVPDPLAGKGAAAQAYTASLPTPLAGCVSIALLEVHRGKGVSRGAGTTAIAELAILADVELTPEGAAPLLAAQVVTGGLAGESAARALIVRGGAAVPALRVELERTKGAARGRLLATLAQIRDPAVTALLATALAAGELTDTALVNATATLAALGPDGKAALLAAIANPVADEASRIAAATALATIDRAALIALVGRGRPTFRAALARLIVPLGAPALVAAAQAGADELVRADLWRAVALAVTPADRAATAAAMRAALDAAGDRYELRYRLIAGLAALGDDADVRGLGAVLARLADDPYGRALARVGAHGLAENSTPEAQVVLATLAAAADAGTRLDAIRGLALEPAAAATADRALIAALGADVWPAIRKSAATALGQRCGRPDPRAALIQAIGGDADIPVRVDAVTALARCAAPDLDARLLALADDPATPLPVRDRALAAFADLPRGAAVDVAVVAVLARFTRWRGQAFSNDDALRMAIRAATALGSLGDSRAGDALVDAAGDTAFPELGAAAIRALGALGPACPHSAPPLLHSLKGSDERQIALAARAALSRCK